MVESFMAEKARRKDLVKQQKHGMLAPDELATRYQLGTLEGLYTRRTAQPLGTVGLGLILFFTLYVLLFGVFFGMTEEPGHLITQPLTAGIMLVIGITGAICAKFAPPHYEWIVVYSRGVVHLKQRIREPEVIFWEHIVEVRGDWNKDTEMGLPTLKGSAIKLVDGRSNYFPADFKGQLQKPLHKVLSSGIRIQNY